MRAVLALALLALVGAQVVSAGLIYQQTYASDYVNHPENFFCNGTANPVAKNYTGGACNNGFNNATSFAYYCDGGAYVIAVAYSSGDCPAVNVTSMSRTPLQCGAGSTAAKWVCSGTDALPNGWSFPPSGWATSTTQYNNTNDGTYLGSSVPACGNVNRPVTVQGASNPICVNTQGNSNQTPRRSSRSYHDNWAATFNDYGCLAANVQTVTQGFPTGACQNGVTQSGITGGPDAPSVPINYATNSIKASRTYYSKTGDSNYCGTKISTTYYASTCFDSLKVECQNGTQYYESYYGVNTDGACPGTPTTSTWRNTSSAYCMQSGTTDYGFSYSCSGNSPSGGNSASTASFSVVALAIAALVALLSQ